MDNVWLLLFVVFLMFTIFFIVVNRRYLNSPKDFGTYATPVVSECNVNLDECEVNTTVSGTATSTKVCVPNGRVGCLNSATGEQTFASITQTVPCTYICPSAKWVTTQTVPCTYYYDELGTQPVSGCVFQDESLYPLVKTTRTCVTGSNPSGVNMCTLANGTTVQPGFIETTVTTCTSGSIPLCGLFKTCSGQLAYSILPDITTSYPLGEDMWAEGVYITPTACTYITAEGKIVTDYPPTTGPPSTVCYLPSGAMTRPSAPTPTQVTSKTIDNPQIQTISSANPSCFRLARNYPSRGSTSIPAIYQTLLNRPCLILKNNTVMSVANNGLLIYVPPNNCTGWGYGDLDGYLSAGLLFWLGSPGRIFGITPLGLYGWVVSNNTFSPAQESYLTTTGQVASGSTIANASITTLTINSELSSPYPGVSYWNASLSLIVNSQPASNVTLVAMPPSSTLSEPYILDRGSCGFV